MSEGRTRPAVLVGGALAMGLVVAWLATRSTAPLLRPFAAVAP